MPQAPSNDPGEPSKGSLLVIFLTVFIDLLGFGMVLPLLPIYAKQFAIEETGLTVGALMAIFSLMQFLFAPAWGRLSDRIGRRPVLMVGLAGSTASYALFGLATVWQNLPLLFLSRLLAGVAGATISTAQAYIADCTTKENRAKGMALIGASFGLGFAIGPVVAALALPEKDAVPGPGPGFAAAGLSLIALLLATFKLPESLRPGTQTAHRTWIDWRAMRDIWAVPSLASLILAMFVCIFAFANFETTLSLLLFDRSSNADAASTHTEAASTLAIAAPGLPGNPQPEQSRLNFGFTYHQVCYTYALIGVVLTLAQGLIVRRLATVVKEGTLAAGGAVLQMGAFGLLLVAIQQRSLMLLFVALVIVVCGFSSMMPSLNALISRRTDPAQQGRFQGVAQSASALARIAGPLVAVPAIHWHPMLPYLIAIAMMLLGLTLVISAARGGQDFGTRPNN